MAPSGGRNDDARLRTDPFFAFSIVPSPVLPRISEGLIYCFQFLVIQEVITVFKLSAF